jgi:4-hydroxybenzoate polyprenyltransferase
MSAPWQTTARGLGLLAFYLLVFWQIFKTHEGNRVVRCGVIALTVCFALAALMKMPAVPDWVLGSVGLLLLFLCLLTMAFLFQQGYRAIRSRLRKTH